MIKIKHLIFINELEIKITMEYNNKYCLLDSGNLQKLEQVGPHRLIRPALNAFWPPTLATKEWDQAIGLYKRNSSGSGQWSWKKKPPATWIIEHGNISFIVKPTDFGHLGFFPEQLDNWQWLEKATSDDKEIRALNLFAYSGGSSLAMAQSNVSVCHVDAAKGMVDWAKNNLLQNKTIPSKIRWITDDVNKFVDKELRRKTFYQGIVLDPPSFGRGPRGQVWKIEQNLIPLLHCLKKLMGPTPKFMLLSMHSHGFSPKSLERILFSIFKTKGNIQSGEMLIAEQTGRKLPAGIFAKWQN